MIRRWTRRAALPVMQVLAPSMVNLFLLGGDVYDVVFVPIVHLDPSARALITSLFVKGNELLLWGPTPDWAEAPAGAWIPGRWRDALPCTTIITSRRGKFPCHAKLREVTVGSDGKRTISWRKQRKS